MAEWESFYVIVGSAAAALVGVQFVVIALIVNLRKRATAESIRAFGTPTVIHLGGALLVSAIMCAPWPSLWLTSGALAACGLAGLGYCAMVVRRARVQTLYKPVREDWIWHVIVPSSVYAAFALGALLLGTSTVFAPFLIGAGALGLLFIGIHNAWDSVTYMVADSNRDMT